MFPMVIVTPRFRTTKEKNIVTVVLDYHLIEVGRIAMEHQFIKRKLKSHIRSLNILQTDQNLTNSLILKNISLNQ